MTSLNQTLLMLTEMALEKYANVDSKPCCEQAIREDCGVRGGVRAGIFYDEGPRGSTISRHLDSKVQNPYNYNTRSPIQLS